MQSNWIQGDGAPGASHIQVLQLCSFVFNCQILPSQHALIDDICDHTGNWIKIEVMNMDVGLRIEKYLSDFVYVTEAYRQPVSQSGSQPASDSASKPINRLGICKKEAGRDGRINGWCAMKSMRGTKCQQWQYWRQCELDNIVELCLDFLRLIDFFSPAEQLLVAVVVVALLGCNFYSCLCMFVPQFNPMQLIGNLRKTFLFSPSFLSGLTSQVDDELCAVRWCAAVLKTRFCFSLQFGKMIIARLGCLDCMRKCICKSVGVCQHSSCVRMCAFDWCWNDDGKC